MVTESTSRYFTFFFIIPAAAIVLLIALRRHGRKVRACYILGFLLPVISLASLCFLSARRTYILYAALYVLGELLRAGLPIPLAERMTGKILPLFVKAVFAVIGAAFLVLLPIELALQDPAIATVRWFMRFSLNWVLAVYLLTALGSFEAGSTRIAVFLCAIYALMYAPFIIVAAVNWLSGRVSYNFTIYDQDVVNYYVRYSVLNLLIALFFAFRKTAPPAALIRNAPPPGTLSRREWEIAVLLCRGLSYREIGDKLFISLHTVRNHCHNIFDKCGVRSRFQLAAILGSSRAVHAGSADSGSMAVGNDVPSD